VIGTGWQELVEITDAARVVKASSDADAVCLDETADSGGMPAGESTDSSVNLAVCVRDDDLKMKPVDTVQQTGTQEIADTTLCSIFVAVFFLLTIVFCVLLLLIFLFIYAKSSLV